MDNSGFIHQPLRWKALSWQDITYILPTTVEASKGNPQKTKTITTPSQTNSPHQECNDASFTLSYLQQCTGTVCVSLSLSNCECPTAAESCHICCELSNGTCASTIRIAAENTDGLRDRLPNSMGRYQVGFPCGNFTGYCDFFNNCMIVNSEGALRRLTNIFSSEAFLSAIDWIRNMWWAVLLIGVGVLVIMFFIVLICHLILPRPKHAKKRAERRRTIRRSRKQERRNPVQGVGVELKQPYTQYSEFH